MIRPKQFARIGMFHLEEAILDVLLEAKHEDQCLGAAAISRRAGIFRDGGEGGGDPQEPPKSMNDAIVTGLLVKMFKEGRVVKCKQSPIDKPDNYDGWELTDAEFERRRDDVNLG